MNSLAHRWSFDGREFGLLQQVVGLTLLAAVSVPLGFSLAGLVRPHHAGLADVVATILVGGSVVAGFLAAATHAFGSGSYPGSLALSMVVPVTIVLVLGIARLLFAAESDLAFTTLALVVVGVAAILGSLAHLGGVTLRQVRRWRHGNRPGA